MDKNTEIAIKEIEKSLEFYIEELRRHEEEHNRRSSLLKGTIKGLRMSIGFLRREQKTEGECKNYIHKYKCPVYNENPDNCNKCDRRGDENEQ